MIARLSQATSAALVLLLNWWILFFTHTKRNRCHCPKFTKHQTNCDFESVYQAWDFQVASLYPRTRLREPVAAHSNCHWFRNALCLLLPVQRTHTRHWAANSLRETTGVMVRRQKGLKLDSNLNSTAWPTKCDGFSGSKIIKKLSGVWTWIF